MNTQPKYFTFHVCTYKVFGNHNYVYITDNCQPNIHTCVSEVSETFTVYTV